MRNECNQQQLNVQKVEILHENLKNIVKEKEEEIKRMESELFNMEQHFHCDMTLLEKAIKGEEKMMMNGTLTIQPRFIQAIEPSKDGKQIYVFNMLLKGHDEKHTL